MISLEIEISRLYLKDKMLWFSIWAIFPLNLSVFYLNSLEDLADDSGDFTISGIDERGVSRY